MIDLDLFDFPLPDEQIARKPAEPRDSARLMLVPRNGGPVQHRVFRDLPQVLDSNDLVVLNTTRVIHARLFGVSAGGRRFEVFLLSAEPGAFRWSCLVKPGRSVSPQGQRLEFAGGRFGWLRRHPVDSRQFTIEFEPGAPDDFWGWLQNAGEVPLPPYLKRSPCPADAQWYQTVYAQAPGSVAAPTAGLHFTPRTLGTLKDKGVDVQSVVLHIGYGTFGPLDPTADHLHEEHYQVPASTLEAVERVRARGGRVVAIGTTSLRALESAHKHGVSGGKTDLFIRPGYPFGVVDGLLTNFHLPRSSLFILVAALIGRERAQAVYKEAIERGYRFFSYGDAMLVL